MRSECQDFLHLNIRFFQKLSISATFTSWSLQRAFRNTQIPKWIRLRNGTCALHWKMFLNIDIILFSRFTSHICWKRILSLKLRSSLILLHSQNHHCNVAEVFEIKKTHRSSQMVRRLKVSPVDERLASKDRMKICDLQVSPRSSLPFENCKWQTRSGYKKHCLSWKWVKVASTGYCSFSLRWT